MYGYAWAVQLLGDGVMWRFMLEVESTGALKTTERHGRRGTELVFPENGVELRRLHVEVNTEVRDGDARFYRFEPEAELRPADWAARPERLRLYPDQRKLPDPGFGAYLV